MTWRGERGVVGGWKSGPRRNVLTLQSQAMTLLHYKMETEG